VGNCIKATWRLAISVMTFALATMLLGSLVYRQAERLSQGAVTEALSLTVQLGAPGMDQAIRDGVLDPSNEGCQHCGASGIRPFAPRLLSDVVSRSTSHCLLCLQPGRVQRGVCPFRGRRTRPVAPLSHSFASLADGPAGHLESVRC
jgi:hypothetical protein